MEFDSGDEVFRKLLDPKNVSANEFTIPMQMFLATSRGGELLVW